MAGVQAEEAAEIAAVEAEDIAQTHAGFEDKSDAEILAALELPDPDTLTPEDDFSSFMAKAVPEHLRRRALRVLWRSNPVLANVDMLVDYGEDFTDASMVIENMQTTYQVGKGMLKHVQEMARQAEVQDADDTDVECPDEAEDDAAPDQSEGLAEVAVEVAESNDLPPPPDAPEADFVTPAPRRMTFQIEETA